MLHIKLVQKVPFFCSRFYPKHDLYFYLPKYACFLMSNAKPQAISAREEKKMQSIL